jgi:hypothetical protein
MAHFAEICEDSIAPRTVVICSNKLFEITI